MSPVTRIARQDESDELARLILSANPHLTGRIENFRKHGYFWHDVVPVVCEVRGELASCACIFKRTLRVGTREAAFCGIGAVATRPDFRRQGLAAAVLHECESLIDTWGYELGLLFCSIVDFYAQQGWTVVEDRVAEFGLHPDQQIGRADYRVQQIETAQISDALRAIADQHSAVVRTAASWKEYTTWRKDDADLMLGAFAGDQLVAYGRARRTGVDEVRLMDAAWLPRHEGAILAVLRQQSGLTHANTPAGWHAFLSPEHPLCVLLDEIGTPVTWRRIPPELGVLMTKTIRRGGGQQPQSLHRADFSEPMPWRPRSWWGIDRF